MWCYSIPQGFTKVSLVLGINTRQNEDTKIAKDESLFCKNCSYLHNWASSMSLLDTLANYGSLFLLLSLQILLIKSFPASRGHCPHHVVHADSHSCPKNLVQSEGTKTREMAFKMLMLLWQLHLSLSQNSFTVWKSTCRESWRALWQPFFSKSFGFSLCQRKFPPIECVNQHNNMAGILNIVELLFFYRKRKRLIKEWLITWILCLIVCKKIGWEGSSFNLVSE